MKQVIDTNVFLRFLVPDKINTDLTDQARVVFQRIEEEKLAVSTHVLIIAELIYVLEGYYEKPKEEVHAIVSKLLALPGVFIENKDEIFASLSIYKEYRVDFEDAYTYVFAKKINATEVLTFDKKHFKRFPDLPISESTLC